MTPNHNSSRILVWYRNDLRSHDHEPLHRALQENAQIIPLYCLDPRHFQTTPFGFPKTGAFRAQFLRECLLNLRETLQHLGSNLIIRQGKPEHIITKIAQEIKIDKIYYSREITWEETQVERAIRHQVKPLGITVKGFWTSTLIHPDDLPFPLSQIPEIFTQFRQKVEKKWHILPPLPTPQKLPPLPPLESGEIPTLQDLNLEPFPKESKGVLAFQGGEKAGLERLNHYFWQQDALKAYKLTRNGMLGADYSSKFSPWLALGCLSPRFIYGEVKRYETERVKNDSTYWLIFELLWRDYFRFICAKHGNKIFWSSGIQGLKIPWLEDWDLFERWRKGETGYPLVDANMQELLKTGFMSNRGRQNVGSFLTKNLGINWQMGAEWFESMLIDYDVCSNWGNWNYTAGVGNDGRGFRYFNIAKQGKDYDPQGDYVKHWLPMLANLPPHLVHEPWKMTQLEQQLYGVRLGEDYPKPMVDFMASVKQQEKVYSVNH
ncbi:DASH family cryptochrome [Spirulina subsalsa FACHB-351]|uniref:Cryptochrome DASH n=1 Tax=Spirulina subsalsa FACHB-351 TaxID=234711 RepID=A0ABT3LAF5_9CYAN|nr:DASH family cryptochrome [Spirulina subsalsa]MCW6038491.1 DASH family cryptochrome [Spirulina subsalsa FACHB-351]